jgi:hypothetical protein
VKHIWANILIVFTMLIGKERDVQGFFKKNSEPNRRAIGGLN